MEVFIIVPAYNEAASIHRVLEEVRRTPHHLKRDGRARPFSDTFSIADKAPRCKRESNTAYARVRMSS